MSVGNGTALAELSQKLRARYEDGGADEDVSDLLDASVTLDALDRLMPAAIAAASSFYCDVCGGAEDDGHFPECWLRDLLALRGAHE